MWKIVYLVTLVLNLGCAKHTQAPQGPPSWHLNPPENCASGSAEITFDDVGMAKDMATNNARGNLAGSGNHTVINGYPQQAVVIDGTIYVLMCLGDE